MTIALTQDEIHRYRRHFPVPHIGPQGQCRIKAAKVALVGLGGIGSPAASYLAAAGIGTLGLVDDDTVSLSNLHRQILYRTSDIDRPKAQVAAEQLHAQNPHTQCQIHETRLNPENAHDVLQPYDLILDGSDNFDTRYLVNQIAHQQQKPLISASVFQFAGQIFTRTTPQQPCYQCIYPARPPAKLIPNCSQAGVLGVLPGILATMATQFVFHHILAMPDRLATLYEYQANPPSLTPFDHHANPNCPTCGSGTEHTVPEESPMSDTPPIPEVTVTELKAKMDQQHPFTLVDVRDAWEMDINHIPGAIPIHLSQITAQANTLPQHEDIILHCRSGMRSLAAAQELYKLGYRRVFNLQGGILAWVQQIDPSQPSY